MRRASARVGISQTAAALTVGLLLATILAPPALAADRTRPRVSGVRMTRLYFSPNGDGVAEYSYVWFRASERARVSAYVSRSARTPIIRTLARNRAMAAGRCLVPWNGRDAANNVVADGWYLVRLYVKDYSGNRAGRYPYTLWVCVDTARPNLERAWAAISPFSPNARPDGYKDRTAIRSKVSEGGHVALTITGKGHTRSWPHVGRRAGTSQIIWNGRDQAGYRVPDGYYTAVVRFHDWAGNNSVPLTQTVRLRVDTTPPSVTNVRVNTATPYEPDGNNDTATVYFTTSEKASYAYSIWNPFWTYLKGRSMSSLAPGNHATSWDAKQRVGSTDVVVPNGRYPIRLVLRDAAGNARVTTPRFTIKSYYLVCVDPGHGGKNGVYDSGAVGPTGYKESVANFDMGYYRLRPLLEAIPESSANGYPVKVLMTRAQERIPSMTLAKRSWIANYRGANIFVSIHCNAAGGSAHGSETFYYRTAEKSTAAQSAYLATMIQRKTVARTSRYNRGVKTASFYVLRRTRMPAALHEAAFISNRTEERLLKSTAFRRSVAQGVRDGIVAYFQRYP